MKLADMLSFFKAAPVREPSDVPRSPVRTWSRNATPVVEYSNVIAGHMALQHPIVFRALNKIAGSVQQVKWYAEADPDVLASERAGASVIKDINAVLNSPNDTLASDQLRYWMALNYAVYGRVPFKVGIGVNGNPNAIYPLSAQSVSAIVDSRGQIKEYEYGTTAGGSKIRYPTRKQAEREGSNKGYVHEIYTPNLDATIEKGKNITALGAIGLPAEVVTMLLRRAYDTASGHPNSKYVIVAEKTLTQDQKDALQNKIDETSLDGEAAGETLFLYNTKIEIHKLDNDLSDIHSKMPSDDMARMIYGAFGIPISLVGMGAADGAKFAGNYKESRQSFWEDTIIPFYITPIATGLTAALCPYGARVRFDLDSIDAIQDSRVGRAQTLSAVDFLTQDEKRELTGYAPLTEQQRADLASSAAPAKPPVANKGAKS
jgi:hypothetical protein